MKGIALINEQICLGALPKEESIECQKDSVKMYCEEQNIELIKLNPSQVNNYYTLPHALLYDLKQQRPHLDCLIIHSERVMEDFIASYPARWLLLKSFFDVVVYTAEQKDAYLEGAG